MPNSTVENRKLYNKEYYQKNKIKISEKNKLGRDSDDFIKRHKISQWKFAGIKSDDYEELHEKFMNTSNCENCDKEFIKTFDKCLDHDHNTGDFRYVLCRNCNSSRKFRKESVKVQVTVNIFYC